MRNPLMRRGGRDRLLITVRLQRSDDLFAPPGLLSFDPAFAPYSVGPAIEYVVEEMERHPDAEGVSPTVLLPPDRFSADPVLRRPRTRRSPATRGHELPPESSSGRSGCA